MTTAAALPELEISAPRLRGRARRRRRAGSCWACGSRRPPRRRPAGLAVRADPLRADRRGRRRHDRLPPLRDGPGHPQLAARSARRRAGRRLRARAASSRATATRATATRTPTARTASATSTTLMRVAGATARSMLIAAAAARWSVPAERLIVRDHAVHDPATGAQARLRRAGRGGRGAARAGSQEPSSCGPTPSCVQSAGHLPLLDGPAFVTGKAALRRRRAACPAC